MKRKILTFKVHLEISENTGEDFEFGEYDHIKT